MHRTIIALILILTGCQSLQAPHEPVTSQKSQNYLIVHGAWEIQQTDIEVFYLHADGINFRQCVLDVLESLVAFGAPSRYGRTAPSSACRIRRGAVK